MARKVSKAVKRRLTLLGPIAIGVFLLCLTTIATYTIRINNLKKKQTELQTELESLKGEEEVLENEIARLKDPEYIAKFAREKYYYTKNGEFVIKLENEATEEQERKEIDSKIWYVFTFGVVLIVTLTFIALFKSKK